MPYRKGQTFEEHVRELEAFTQNLPAIAKWFEELTELWEEILKTNREACSALEQLGEPELAKRLDLVIAAFSSSFYDVFAEEEEQGGVENLDAAVDNPQAIKGSLESDSTNKETPE